MALPPWILVGRKVFTHLVSADPPPEPLEGRALWQVQRRSHRRDEQFALEEIVEFVPRLEIGHVELRTFDRAIRALEGSASRGQLEALGFVS